MSAIAERLKKLRGSEAQGVFAARLGLKQAVYCHYEKGRREPSLDALVNIALRLGCSTDWLLGVPGVPDPSAPPREETKTAIRTGDGSTVINGGVNGSGNIVGNSINVTPPSQHHHQHHRQHQRPGKGRRRNEQHPRSNMDQSVPCVRTRRQQARESLPDVRA